MLKYFLISGLVAGVLVLSGCSSGALNSEVTEDKPVQPEKRAIETETANPDQPIDPQAFHYYENGLLYEGIGNYPKAAASYGSALKFHPESYQIRYSLAEAYLHLRRYDQTIEVLSKISPEDADVHLLRGAAYASLGMDDSARVSYLKLIELEPDNSMAFSHLAGFYRRARDADSLVWAYENLVRIRPDNERIWRELGRLQAQRRDYAAARESFRRSVEIQGDATNILSYLGIAEVYQIEDKVDSAIAAYKVAVEVDPLNFVANRELSALMVSLDSLEVAIQYARRVVEAAPLDRDAVRRLGVLYFGVDSLSQADSILTYLVNSGERNSVNHYYLGRIGLVREDYQKAVGEFTVLTQLADSVSESWLNLGYAYRRMADIDKEILTYQTGLNHVSDEQGELDLLFSMGAANEQAGRFEQAVSIFEEIIAKSPSYSKALNYLGYMLADRGERLEYARDLIEKAVTLVPDNAAYLDSYGWVLYRLEEYDKALIHLRKAVSLDSDPVIYDHLGDAYKATGDHENARVWWQKALELAPDNEEIKKKLTP